MAKKKADWIKQIVELDDKNEGLLGEISREELDTFTIGQLKALVKDMEEEIAQANLPAVTEEQTEDGDAEDGADEKITLKPFESMCGSEYNPKKSGECVKSCQVDFPEAFAACTANYEMTEVGSTRTSSSKPRAGKTPWGHTNGKQGGLIDDFFYEGKVGTLTEVAEFAGGKEPRVMHHMKHLVADKSIEILWNFKTDKDGETPTKKKIYWWSEKDKRRKGTPLEGKSVKPNK